MYIHLLELSLISLIASAITAIAGLGGGMLLLAILPTFLPANSIIAVHGTVQLASNASRFLFGFKDAVKKPILVFLAGALIGSFLGYTFIGYLNSALIPLLTSIFILIILWLPFNKWVKRIRGKYFTLGIFQTAISLFVGVTGPLSTSVLISDGYKSNQVVVTNAAINTILNILKTILFFLLGFNFHTYILEIIFMCFFAVIGSKIGTEFRGKIKENHARVFLKWLITIICIKQVYVFFS